MKMKEYYEIPENFSGIIEWCDGAEHCSWTSVDYYKNGEYHREDGPAVTFLKSGNVEHYLHNNLFTKEEWKIELARLQALKLEKKTKKKGILI